MNLPPPDLKGIEDKAILDVIAKGRRDETEGVAGDRKDRLHFASDARPFPVPSRKCPRDRHDLGRAYRKAVQAFAHAGCRYLQLDETNLAYLCDPEQRQIVRDRGANPDELPHAYARPTNTAISSIAPEMRITMHTCRGNFRSLWIAEGGYEPVAEVLFHEIGQLCLSPQCGFAGIEDGDVLSHENRGRTGAIVQVSHEIWD